MKGSAVRIRSPALKSALIATLVGVKAQQRASKRNPWQLNEEAQRRQLRVDGRRPLAVNLAEGLALSEFLSTFTGSARQR